MDAHKKDNLLDSISSKTTGSFLVPDNYFIGLEPHLKSVIKLNTLKLKNSFDIPDDYFKVIYSVIQSQIINDKYQEFTHVPEGYFEKLNQQVLSKIQEENTKTKHSLLSRISDNTGLSVPENYFNASIVQINKQIAGDYSVIKPLFLRKPASFYYRIAAALIILIGLSISLQTVFNVKPISQVQSGNHDNNTNIDLSLLADIDEETIVQCFDDEKTENSGVPNDEDVLQDIDLNLLHDAYQ